MKYQKDLDLANKNGVEYSRSLSTFSENQLTQAFNNEHKEVFSEIDCLQCANCCKNHSPIITQTDMDRIAKHLNISTSDFLMNYLEMDEEGDFVYKQQPCPFLLKDNKCKIYDVRPEACADFPHTNRNDMNEILDLTLTNSTVCPAVSRMIKNMLSNT